MSDSLQDVDCTFVRYFYSNMASVQYKYSNQAWPSLYLQMSDHMPKNQQGQSWQHIEIYFSQVAQAINDLSYFFYFTINVII